VAGARQNPDPDGAETTHRTRKALLEAVRTRAIEILDGSIEATKSANPFLHDVPAKHYGFTGEELDFIINYDIKYRMGQDAGGEGDEHSESGQ
jgi:hypothetical protein